MKKYNKKILKELQDVYDYSRLLRSPLTPRAKLVVAQEIHELFSRRVYELPYMKDEDFNQYVLMLIETTEQMLLDMLNRGDDIV